ncbi:adenylosuccinate synthetase [Candidatus Jorgensenbacteria bacterium]|nr:adenylosuccinate synthetase [Candidatus Jorgensenbacteria bacterium]
MNKRKQIFIVTGLGYGDEGKGGTTHWLCSTHRAHTVIRTGGAQAFHRVLTASGKEHIFSQFGSGTLRGSATHLSKNMVIDPHAILAEGEALKHEQGISSVFETLTIHEDALVISPFQLIAGRLREILRGKNRYGSVGIGIGETILDAEIPEAIPIRAKDLTKPDIAEKLEAIRLHKLTEFEALADRASLVSDEIREAVCSKVNELENHDIVQWAVERFAELAKRVRIVDTDYVAEKILSVPGTIVVESSQGVLLDRWYGFHPFITKVRAVPEIAFNLIDECNYDGEVKSFGILRAYHTRHGSGPFVTENQKLTKELPDTTNGNHAWQGSFRVGYFDMVAAKYAIEACRGFIDGLVITCLDRIQSPDVWEYCDAYQLPTDTVHDGFFSINKRGGVERIIARHKTGNEQSERQEKLGNFLRTCTPTLMTAPKDSIIPTIEGNLGLPVIVKSFGPTENDKIEIIKKGSSS